MPTMHKVARSVEEYVKIVSDLEADWHMEGLLPWVRGHANAEWPLLPKFYRQRNKTRWREDEIRESFITRAPILSDITPASPWDWYFVMQHHRAPTRLLDWTEGALIGLYFAVREDPGHHHAAVWVLDPWQLNWKVAKKDEVVPPSAPGTSRQDRQRYAKWLPDCFTPRKRWPLLPVAIYPSHIVRRIGVQRSCFTIHGSNQSGLEEIARRIKIPLLKITIPSWEAKAIRRSLYACGIDETTIFPDLEGLSKAVESQWVELAEDLPHRRALTRLRPSMVDKGGIGVFAIRRIRRNTPLFVGENDEMVWLKSSELPRTPKSVRRLYEDFPVIKTDADTGEKRYGCPVNFNRLTISWYLNESREPNVRCDEYFNFFADRNIAPGEELTVDYSTYSD